MKNRRIAPGSTRGFSTIIGTGDWTDHGGGLSSASILSEFDLNLARHLLGTGRNTDAVENTDLSWLDRNIEDDFVDPKGDTRGTIEDVLAGKWKQYQFGNIDDLEIIVAGKVDRITIGKHKRFAIHGTVLCKDVDRTWKELDPSDPFLVPGPSDQVVIEPLPHGRVVIISARPLEFVVLFPEGDTGEPVQIARDRTVDAMDLPGLNVKPFTPPAPAAPFDPDIPF